MTQAEFEREVAENTGESCATIRRRGFSLLVMPERDAGDCAGAVAPA